MTDQPRVKSVEFIGKKEKTQLLYELPGQPVKTIRHYRLRHDLDEIWDIDVLVAIWEAVREKYLADKISRSGLRHHTRVMIQGILEEIKSRGMALEPEPVIE